MSALGLPTLSPASRTAAIPQDAPQLWVFVLEVRPLPQTDDFTQFGGAYVLCYQMPGLAEDPIGHASRFLREHGWEVIGVHDEPRQLPRGGAPEAEHFDQALRDDEAYVFHQWRVEDEDDQTRH